MPYCIRYSEFDDKTQRIVTGPWSGGCLDCSFPGSSSSSRNLDSCIACANIYKVLPTYVLDSGGNPGLEVSIAAGGWDCGGHGVLPPQARRPGGEWLFLVPRHTLDGANMNGIVDESILGALGTMTWNGVGGKQQLSSHIWNFVEYVQPDTIYEIRGASWTLGQDILGTICFGDTLSGAGSSSSSSSAVGSSSSSAGSSSSSAGSSSSSAGSSSSSAGCGPFNLSITTQLGLNPETPDLFFGENVGVSVVSTEQVTLSYDNLNVSGLPFVMEIQLGGNLLASVTMATNYLNKTFAFTYQGATYCGTFVSGAVTF